MPDYRTPELDALHTISSAYEHVAAENRALRLEVRRLRRGFNGVCVISVVLAVGLWVVGWAAFWR